MALTDNLLAYWKLDGNSTDATGNGHDGTDAGVSYSTSYGKINEGAYYGASSRSNVGSLSSSTVSQISISLWIKKPLQTVYTFDPMFAFNGWSAYGHFSLVTIYNTNLPARGKIYLYVYGDSSGDGNNANYFSTASIDDDAWHHVAVVCDTTTGVTKYYIDGSLDNTTPSYSIPAINLSAVLVGGWYVGGNYYGYKGDIDEVGVWDRLLSDTEVSQLYNSGNGLAYPLVITKPLSDNVMAYYRFDGDANDASGNGHHGTATDVLYSSEAGKINRGAYFNGMSSNIAVNIPTSNLTEMSISAWIKPERTNNSDIHGILSGGLGFYASHFGLYDSEYGDYLSAVMFLAVGPYPLSSAVTLFDGNWHLASMSFKNSTVSFYLDGNLVNSKADYDFVYSNMTSIGCYNFYNILKYYKGYMDELCVWSRALNDADMANLYHTGTGYQYPFKGEQILRLDTDRGEYEEIGKPCLLSWNIPYKLAAACGYYLLNKIPLPLKLRRWVKETKPSTTWKKLTK